MGPMDRLLNAVEWEEVPRTTEEGSDLPYATHRGVLHLEGIDLRCYQLNTGMRVLDADDVEAFFKQL